MTSPKLLLVLMADAAYAAPQINERQVVGQVFNQLLWTWLFQTQRFQALRSWIFQVLWSHRQLGLLLWIPEFRCFRVDNHLLCGLPTSAFHCCCCGSGPGWFQEELQCFPGKCQQGARVCRRPS